MALRSRKAESITPYVAGEQPQDRKYIKLNTNENPYPPSPKVAEVLHSFPTETLPLYPDPESNQLRAAIAQVKGVAPTNIFVGNGSDEVLALCFPAFFNPDDEPVAFFDVTYSFYPVFCNLYGIRYVEIPLLKDFSVDVDALCQTPCAGLVLTNPNAPTGRAMAQSDILRILQTHPDCVVIVDEAYIDFGGESMIPYIQQYKNLLVVQTFSKGYGLAGIRVGYAVGDPDLIESLNRIKNSFNSYPLDRIAQTICTAAVQDVTYYQSVHQAVMRTREQTANALRQLGFQVIPSHSNFLFVAHPHVPANTLYARLKEMGILVRYFPKPRIDNFLRITVGSDADMQTLIQQLTLLVKKY